MANTALIETIGFGPYSDAERKKITLMLVKLFNHWKINNETQLSLLGMSVSSRAILSKYRSGERAIPNDIDKLSRAGLLLLIHKNLRMLFPENPNIVYGWVSRDNKNFDNKKPLSLMKQYGLLGLAKVARYLEFELVK